jgi:hypothetical protein
MHGPINVKSLNNKSKWQMGFNSAFKGLINKRRMLCNKLQLKFYKGKGKGKALPLQAWTGAEGVRRWRLPPFKTIGT